MKNTKDNDIYRLCCRTKAGDGKKDVGRNGLSVAEIAERLSYSNAQNFIRLFKKHMVLLLDNIGNSINKHQEDGFMQCESIFFFARINKG